MKQGLLVLALFATLVVAEGCQALVEEDAIFVVYNSSNDDVAVTFNDGEEHQVLANRSDKFKVEILVPYSSYGPSTINQVVQVGIAFRNLRTGRLLPAITCQAGAKVVTKVQYQVTNGYESSTCLY